MLQAKRKKVDKFYLLIKKLKSIIKNISIKILIIFIGIYKMENILNFDNKNILEYINLNNLDFEYAIEEIIFDTNKFEFKEMPELLEDVNKNKKKKEKNLKEVKNKNIKINNKHTADDLSLSKKSSKLSIYSTNSVKDSKGSKKQGVITGQKLKVTIGGSKGEKNINVSLDKNKFPVKLISQLEEIVNNVEEEQKNKVNPKKKNKKEKVKSKEEEIKKEDKEIKKEDKTTKENKRVDDFLKSVKDKKKVGKGTKSDEKLSIKSVFLDKHKYLFIVDPSQRLRLRDLAILNREVILSFFQQIEIIFKSFEHFSNDEEYIKLNVKETVILIDNLAEICVAIESLELLKITLEKSLDLAYDLLNKENNYQHFTVILNIFYTLYKNKLEIPSYEVDVDKVMLIYKILLKKFNNCISSNKNINLRENEEIVFYSLSKSFISIILSDKKRNYDEGIFMDDNLKNLIKNFESSVINSNTDEYDEFMKEYSNLRFFTKFSYLFDKMKNRFYSLNIKTSRSLESSLTELQDLLILKNEQLFAVVINKILMNYINNFDMFYECNEELYDDVFNLMKYLCDGKLFSHEYINKIFVQSSDKKYMQLNLRCFTFQTDESWTKYLSIIIKYLKYFEKIFDEKKPYRDNIQIFLYYFHQVLFTILNLKQGYIREKYYKIIHKQIEPRIEDSEIAEQISNSITELISENLISNLNSNLIKNIKTVKEVTKFYSTFAQVKQIIFKFFEKEVNNDIKMFISTIFLINFLNLDDSIDNKLLHFLILNSDNFVKNILFIDKKLCSYLMKYYINDEINLIDKITDIIFEQLACQINCNNFTLFDNLTSYLLSCCTKFFSSNDSNDLNLTNLNLILQIIEQLISKDLFKLNSLLRFVDEFLKIKKCENKKSIFDSTIIYFINKLDILIQNEADTVTNNLDQYIIIIEDIKKKQSLASEFDLLTEISLINDNVKKISVNDYFITGNQLLPYVMELIKLEKTLKNNPDYFKVDNIMVESISLIDNEEDKKQNESDNKNIPINKSQINMDIILEIFKNYFKLTLNSLKVLDENTPAVLYNITVFQEIINRILTNDHIFNNLIVNKTLLEEFIHTYFNVKEKCFEINQKYLKELKNIEEDSAILVKQDQISINLVCIDLCEKISINCGSFVKCRCKDQIVYLFKEEDIFKMYLTKDREFNKILFEQIDKLYKTTIVNEESVKCLIEKAQNEDEDLLEEVVYSIFSKQVIKYLECPDEIIEFLSTMNDALRFDLKVDRKEFYNSLFSYFYLWKTIMSKIENGFKLYTTDKQYVSTIDNYKTLLKFVINYLERNCKLYEMFLLLVVSLIHLIDDEKMLEDKSLLNKLNNFDDNLLTDCFDQNTLQFLLSVLYKFVKIFPSLVKYYYEESKTKLKKTFNQLNSNIILPNMLIDLKERIKLNSSLLSKNSFKIRETKALNCIEFVLNANEEIHFNIEIVIPPVFPLK